MERIPGAGVIFKEFSFKQATVALHELHVGIRIKLKSRPCRSVQKAIWFILFFSGIFCDPGLRLISEVSFFLI